MNSSKVGKTISFLRKHYNMTQHELADKLGVTDKAVSRWENGYGTPDISILSKLAVALDIDIESLLEGNLTHWEMKWEGLLFLNYPDGITAMDWMYGIRIVEFQLSLFILAGISEITIAGDIEQIESIKKIYDNGQAYGCSIHYVSCQCKIEKNREVLIRSINQDKNVMVISELCFIYGKDITKYFKRIIGDCGSYGKLMNYSKTYSGIMFYGKGNHIEECVIKNTYLERGVIVLQIKDRYDLFDASDLLRIIEKGMGEKVYNLEAIAMRRGMIKCDEIKL